MSSLLFFLALIVVVALLMALVFPFVASQRHAELKRHLETLEVRTRLLENELREARLENYRPSEAGTERQSETDSAENEVSPPPRAATKLPDTPEAESTRKPQEQEKDNSVATPPPPPQPAFSNRDGQRPPRHRNARSPAPKPESQPAPAQSRPAMAKPGKPFPWRKMLEAAQLLPPPSSGESAEVRLAVWWTTRIGAVLLVIAGVFLGVYVSRDSPLLRLLSMAAISAAVIAAGLWLERRYQAFGRIVTSGGLGFAFVTAFAASAFETTRVIESAMLGVLVQMLAIVGMIVWSLWKKDAAVAAMALICGYIACAFSYSHDLAQFVVAGLLMLGTAGSSLLILRRWPAPAMISLGASWCGFLGLIIFDWFGSSGASSPGALSTLSCLVLLTLIFHSAGLLFRHRHPVLATSRRLRIGTLVNTSLAVVAIYLAGRLVYPNYLATFYLTFAALIFGFAVWHRRPGSAHDRGLAQTLFLKSMALLALFFVAQFDGPVRWLSLSLQTATLVYTWHRHRNSWILTAVGVGLTATLAWMGYDLVSVSDAEWSAFSVRSIVGSLSLLVLTASLAAQNHLASSDSEGRGKTAAQLSPAVISRLIAAMGIIVVAIGLAFYDHSHFSNRAIAPIGFIAVLGLAAFQPLWRWRSAVPIVVGGAILIIAALAFLTLPSRIGVSGSGVTLGLCLGVLALACAELVRRRWPATWRGGAVARALGSGFGLILITVTMSRLFDLQSSAPPLAIMLLLLLSLLVAFSLLMQAAPFLKEHAPGNPMATLLRWSISFIAGWCLVGFALITDRNNQLAPFWLALASLPAFAMIYRTRNGVPAMAAGLALCVAWIWLLTEHLFHHPALAPGLVATLGVIAINAVIAWTVSCRKTGERAAFFDFWEITLHCASLVLASVFVQAHYEEPIAFAASTAIALAALFTGLRLPFRRLTQVSFVPILLATLHHVISGSGSDFAPLTVAWLVALAGLVCYLLAFEFARRVSLHAGRGEKISGHLSMLAASLITVAALLLVHCSMPEPWQVAGYVAVGIAGACLWRFAGFPHTHSPSSLAIIIAGLATLRLCLGASSSHESVALSNGLIAAAGTLAFGLILCARQPGANWRKLALMPAAIGTALAFSVFVSSAIGVEQMTTVFWGVTSIVVFVAGLAGGLRNYRLVGLIGLGICLVRMFLVDIDDTLYRIIAFFAISLVLLLIGFLYHRFRQHIEAFDKVEE